MSETLEVEVAYALPGRQTLIALALPAPTTAADAIATSGILAQFPELDLATLNVGIFGHITPLAQPLRKGDRVEIYRPLIHNPKDARRLRAAK
ncbi:MAG: RnfH family protein [Methylovulum sp.]|uniref:RnfH family protein n=1 Tax=Methylovulum sp. TaxID=1916980 RepID=UPI002635AC1C|nr:RnfH family protein [Methylovulum sp.]MDD2722801.1 RnfH family protein [Methylovulum sp.]MDD5124907.1 RnfH family protein [Methylovulum sp.]